MFYFTCDRSFKVCTLLLAGRWKANDTIVVVRQSPSRLLGLVQRQGDRQRRQYLAAAAAAHWKTRDPRGRSRRPTYAADR